MAAALALAGRAAGRTGCNPNVACLLVAADGRIVGAGATADGGRPHAEAVALAMAGQAARGATAYITLEPCAHRSLRGPDCAGALIAAGIARAVVAMVDPDPRTGGRGLAALEAAGIAVVCPLAATEARLAQQGFVGRLAGRPELTLKLALSLDGRLALADGRSQWITGEPARCFAHWLRARADLVLVGGGTLRSDAPRLDVRLPGWRGQQPQRAALTSGPAPEGWLALPSLMALDSVASARGMNRILCEGGGRLAAALLAADRVDRLVLLRAPILLGDGRGLEGLAMADLALAHGRWLMEDRRPLGPDLLEQYRRNR